MKILIATGSGLENRFFANNIVEQLSNVVGIISEHGLKKGTGSDYVNRPNIICRFIERVRKEGIANISSIMYDYFYMRNEDEYVKKIEDKFFQQEKNLTFTEKVPVLEVESINEDKVTAFISKFKPDVMAVQGTSIIKEPILSMFPKGIINIHGGLPKYRGTWPMFWALYYEDFDYLKASLHFIDPGIDTGDIIMERKLELEPDDDHHTLRAKYLVEGTYLMVEALRILERGEELPRLPQDEIEKGRCFFAKDATKEKRLELYKRLRRGLIRNYLKTKEKDSSDF